MFSSTYVASAVVKQGRAGGDKHHSVPLDLTSLAPFFYREKIDSYVQPS
jgi:hypothetical protein